MKAGLDGSQRPSVILPSAPAWLTRLKCPAAFSRKGPGPGHSHPGMFSRPSVVARRRRWPAWRPHPPPAARLHARHMQAVPRHARLRLHPSAISAFAPATPWAPGLAARVGLHRGWVYQWEGGASRSPRPSVPRPWKEGVRVCVRHTHTHSPTPTPGSRMRLPPCPLGQSTRPVGGWRGWDVVEAAEALVGGRQRGRGSPTSLHVGGGVSAEKEGSGSHGLHTLPLLRCPGKPKELPILWLSATQLTAPHPDSVRSGPSAAPWEQLHVAL